ncbi:MAG: epoxyqueuosine reductase QueH [Eubacteriales bacterium]|nr:epoxyqueuosine reductase QueH [Eubacteriales bacterium]
MNKTDCGEKRGIFVHSCCGPCSTAVIERLIPRYRVTVFFYNPNITNEGEYEKRLRTEKKFIDEYNRKLLPEDSVTLIEGPYDPENYLRYVRGFEEEPENGARCSRCFKIRMDMTARFAVKNGFDLFTTTLSVSPHKSTPTIVETGRAIGKKYGIDFLDESFKKKDGFKRSVDLSREYGLYRQNYCGCIFSERPGAGADDPSRERKLRS